MLTEGDVSIGGANGSTASSIAAALASAFNSASGSPVTATSGGGVVTLTSKTVGSSTDYALSATSQTSNPGQFGSPSFTTSASGPTLTGGTGGYNVSLAYAPDGDVLGANDSANGNWTYSYDDFNRLASANATGQAYTYKYDRFGNRWQQNGPHTMMLTFSGANNRMDGYSYDASGNLLNDGSHSYTYDAENRIVTVDGGATTYVYDANGQRVRKTVGGASTDYVYDLAGHAISEVTASGWQRGEVYAGGKHLATYTNGTTYFDHADWLGTERVRTAVNGSVCESITSLPFGDGQSTTGSCAGASTRHFTGKERDAESNLDYFGARYNSSSLGRFMSPDWAAKPTSVPYAEFGDPQSLNLYSYVGNNPPSRADVDGHCYPFCSIVIWAATQPGVAKTVGALGLKVSGGVGVEYGVRSPWGNGKLGAAVTGEVSVSNKGVTVDALAEAKAQGKIGAIQGEIRFFSVKDMTLENGKDVGNKLTVAGPRGEFGTKHTEVTGEKGEVDLGVTASAAGAVAGVDITINTEQFGSGMKDLLQSLGIGSGSGQSVLAPALNPPTENHPIDTSSSSDDNQKNNN